jgi:hypothetical protein
METPDTHPVTSTTHSKGSPLDLSWLRAGAVDPDGDKIIVVYKCTHDFAVYITERGVKHVAMRPTGGKLTAIAPLVLELGRDRERFPFIDQAVAQAKVECLEGNAQEGNEILVGIRNRVANLRTLAGRLQYILVCMAAVGAVVVAASVLSHFSIPEDHLFMIWMAACGSLGAFLSVSLNLRRLEIDPEAPRVMNVISAVSRIVIGMIGAVFVYLVIKGNLILGLLADIKNPAAILAVAIVAGFSETFVPNALRRVEKQADPESPNQAPRGAHDGATVPTTVPPPLQPAAAMRQPTEPV